METLRGERYDGKERPVHDGDCEIMQFLRRLNQCDFGHLMRQRRLASWIGRDQLVETGIGAIEYPVGRHCRTGVGLDHWLFAGEADYAADVRGQADVDTGVGEFAGDDVSQSVDVECRFLDLVDSLDQPRIEEPNQLVRHGADWHAY